MKPPRTLVISLLANCALAVLVGYLFSVRTSGPKPPPSPEAAAPQVKRLGQDPGVAVTNVVSERFLWSRVEADDYKQYIANLRAIQCPEATIRDIIITDVLKTYVGKTAALQAPRLREFWKTESQWPGGDREFHRKNRELEREKRSLLKELLGADVEKDLRQIQGIPDWRGRSMAYLPEEKRDNVVAIEEKYRDLRREILRQGQEGAPSPEGVARLEDLGAKQSAELASLLTPQQVEEYDLRHHEISQKLRADLATFRPTEQEFRTLFRLNKEFAAVRPAANSNLNEGRNQASLATPSKDLEPKIRAALGEQRYAELRRAQDWEYRILARLAEENGLPREAAGKVYDMKTAVEEQKLKVSKNETLTPEQRRAALQAIGTETDRALRGVLGDPAYQAYKRRHGSWIPNLPR